MTITVTREHINKREMDSAVRDCMVARAFKDAGFPNATVGMRTVRPRGLHSDTVTLPSFVAQRIVAFCDGFPVEPFSFELDIPA